MKSNENQYIIKVLLLKVLSEYSIKKFNILIEIIENEFNYILNFTKKNNNEIIENNNINNNNNNNNNHNEKKKNKINKFKNAILNNIPQIKIHSNKISNPKYYSNLIEILFWLINKKSYETASKLPTVINIIMSTKNPSIKEIRESCLEINNQVFSDLYKNFPMLNYNSQSKRIAVGTIEGNIIIYDFDNGNLWKKIEAHKKEISALCFDITGNIIISYSSSENVVKCFKIGVTNFFGKGLFSNQNKPFKSFKLNEIKNKNFKYEEKLDRIKLICNMKKNKEIMLRREDGTLMTLNL